jgi:hypothetical protein
MGCQPHARVTRLKELSESGFGLLDQEVMAEQASTSPVVWAKESMKYCK